MSLIGAALELGSPARQPELEHQEQLSTLFELFSHQLDKAEIREIKPHSRILADLFKRAAEEVRPYLSIKKIDNSLNGILKRIDPDQELVDELYQLEGIDAPWRSSAWAKYAYINLHGLIGNINQPEFLAAVRFSHFVTLEGQVEDLVNQLSQAFWKTLATGFPWENQEVAYYDPRMNQVEQNLRQKTQEKRLPVVSTDTDLMEQRVEIPAIFNLQEHDFKDGQIKKDTKKIICNQVNNRPFIILKVPVPEETDRYLIEVIVNHQYLDGVPVAYHMKQVVDQLDSQLKIVEPSADEMKLADKIETASGPETDAYQVETFDLEQETVDHLNQLYAQITANNDVRVSYNTFLQLALLAYFGVDGQEIKGGILGFNADHTKQLDHFDVGDAQGILMDLLQGNADQLGSLIQGKDNPKLNLYRPEASNLSIVENLSQSSSALSVRLNTLAKELGVDQAKTGQCMGSVVSNHIGDIFLAGNGGPALAEFQDVAFTAAVTFDQTKRQAQKIRLRVKMRKKLGSKKKETK